MNCALKAQSVSSAAMYLRLLLLICGLLSCRAEEQPYHAIELPPHSYYDREPTDRFTRMMKRFESGEIPLDRSSEKAFVVSLLKALNVPVSSQILVYSTTSLQLSLITPRNPRALYFNEDVYVGWVPGGKLEIISLDPELGGIFYIFDIPRGSQPLNIERSRRCMNCHSGGDTAFVPGLVIKSVVAGPTGGSLDSFRREQTGHIIPFNERFGGWYLTGYEQFTNHWANAIGRSLKGEIVRSAALPGELYDWAKFPVAASDILPHLLHEHQAGFVNRAVEAGYRARTLLHLSQGSFTAEQTAELDEQAAKLTSYLLFKDEAPLPFPVTGDSQFKEDFGKSAQRLATGESLKEFQLTNRLFKYRCSYMIYSPLFERLPAVLKERVFARLDGALTGRDAQYAYLPDEERSAIRSILSRTLAGFGARSE